MKKLLFFPAPYPDEILHSVLYRYHIRCGSPSARQTNLALWGGSRGKKIYLPDGIENIAVHIPQDANLTSERFIKESTIFPLLKPFLTQSKCNDLWDAMKFGDPNIYNIVGFTRVFTLQHRHLRYCNKCVAYDTKIYGEPYWHRIHQLPGIYICPLHSVPTIEADIDLNEVHRDYYPFPFKLNNSAQSYEPGIAEKLSNLALDTAWLLQHGYDLKSVENTNELYNIRLRIKGYRHYSGHTSGKRIAQDIVDYYDREFLTLFDAYNSGACTWIKRIIQLRQGFQHPLYHLLLIRFLAGSAEDFFAGVQEKPPDYLPFGSPPYPCRNYVCEYHLQDVIQQIKLTHIKATARAMFVCPHCGFTYRRKGKLPKEKQYSGQIDIVNYGWKWGEAVTKLLSDGISPYKIARDFHCDVRTILAFGIENNLLLSEQNIKRGSYVPLGSTQAKTEFNKKREYYRQRWQALVEENTKAKRTALKMLDSQCDKWLREYDRDWFEQHSPPSSKELPIWADSDDEYLGKVEDAVKQIRDSPGLPRRISISAIGRKARIIKPYVRLASNLLPKTKAFVAAHAETLEQWQKRKILWVIQQMRERGELLTVYKVRHAARIEDRERKLDGFILENIENSE